MIKPRARNLTAPSPDGTNAGRFYFLVFKLTATNITEILKKRTKRFSRFFDNKAQKTDNPV